MRKQRYSKNTFLEYKKEIYKTYHVMSSYICGRCKLPLKLDREIIYHPSGLSNVAIWCYTDLPLKPAYMPEDVIKTMTAIENSGERCHLVNWDFSDEWIKIPEVVADDSIPQNPPENKKHNILVIAVLVVFPIVVLSSVNFVCDYISRNLNL